ncbi:hypothetical protein FM106_22125 [Brachybacterium faecium]|nr:hypothetical protein FM106_22125 [Brachybacterium faecium]
MFSLTKCLPLKQSNNQNSVKKVVIVTIFCTYITLNTKKSSFSSRATKTNFL